MENTTDLELEAIVSEGAARFRSDLADAPEHVSRKLDNLLERAPGTADPVGAALSPWSFPVLGLPVWASRALRLPVEQEFHIALACSSLHGYHFIRLIDNVMDGDGPAELPRLLPLTAVFHTGFERPYHRYFDHGDPFWGEYETLWRRAAFATTEDAFLENIDQPAFTGVSGLKFSAAAVPVAAVAHRGHRSEALPEWRHLIDRLGCWYQMVNDLLDWHHDAAHGIRTYFLSEANRRRRPEESLPEWVSREGFGWAVETLDQWMNQLEREAELLHAPDLSEFLATRRGLFRIQMADAADGLRGLDTLLHAFG
jgi:hypothetical protein